MLRVKKVCCEKCGRLFSKIAGGIISTPTDRINICSKCKLDYAKKYFLKSRCILCSACCYMITEILQYALFLLSKLSQCGENKQIKRKMCFKY